MTTGHRPNALHEFFAERREARRAEKAATEQTPAATTPRGARRYKRKPKPERRVDFLDAVPLLAARAPRLMAVATGLTPPRDSARDPRPDAIFQSKGGRPATRGAAAIVRRFEQAAGVRFELGPDGGLIARTEAGAMTDELGAALDILAPLITAHLAGAPLACAWGDEREAITLLRPGKTPACAEHAELPDAEPPVEYVRAGMAPLDMARQVAARLRGY